jgi:hypothetical protein
MFFPNAKPPDSTKYTYSTFVNFIGFQNNKIRFFVQKYYMFNPDATTHNKMYEAYDILQLICENNIWDTFNIQAGLNLLKHPNSYFIYYEIMDTVILEPRYVNQTGIFKWSDEELAIQLVAKTNVPDSLIDEEDLRTLLIYNVITKEWKKFVFPSIFAGYRILNILEWNDKLYFGFRGHQGGLNVPNIMEYTGPRYTSIDAPEELTTDLIVTNIYPNPATESLSISFDLKLSSFAIIKLCDLLGRELIEVNNGMLDAGSYNRTLNTSNLSSGVYYLKFNVGKEFYVEKVVIK